MRRFIFSLLMVASVTFIACGESVDIVDIGDELIIVTNLPLYSDPEEKENEQTTASGSGATAQIIDVYYADSNWVKIEYGSMIKFSGWTQIQNDGITYLASPDEDIEAIRKEQQQKMEEAIEKEEERLEERGKMIGHYILLAFIIFIIIMYRIITKQKPYSGQASESSTAIAELIIAGDLDSQSVEGLLLKSNEVALLSISECLFFEPIVEESSSTVGGIFGVAGVGYTDKTKTTKMSQVAINGTLLLTNQRLCFGWSSGIRIIPIRDISWMNAAGMSKDAYVGKPDISSPALQISFESKEGTQKCIIHRIRKELSISNVGDDDEDEWVVGPESLEQAITILREKIGKEQKAITPKPEPSKETIKVRCPSCKALADETAKFCPECGTSMM